MPNPGLLPNESDESADPRAELARVSVIVYDGARMGIDKPPDMSATEAVMLLTQAAAHVAQMQFHALAQATRGQKIVRPIQRVVVPGVRRGRKP
ncbi:MAG: hypothetical protein ACYTKD_31750 [Planctomycetota bacterium]|jgi:hypothetical protein